MKVYVYIDESGSIHKNSKTKYFAVGGYITINDDKNRAISRYKKNNLELKRKHNLDLKVEIKSYDMNQDEKIAIFNNVQKIKSFCGFALICNKFVMKKEIIQSNIFFNYAVKLIFKDCIIPILSKEHKEFIVSVDNRNIKVGNLKDLENYLKVKFEPYMNEDIAAVVLGCTHYPFVKEVLARVVGRNVPLIDGGLGTSHELQRKLEEKNWLTDSKEKGSIEIYNSTNDNKIIDFCYNLINA